MKKPFAAERRAAWGAWVTPRLLKEKPIHRWYVFPHSFTSELVYGLVDEWGLGIRDRIIDPFVGAGTTLLAAKEKRVPATGYDLSPLAILASQVKTTDYQVERLEKAYHRFQDGMVTDNECPAESQFPALVMEALPEPILGSLETLRNTIDGLSLARSEKNFFRLALLAILPNYSRAIASGGWLKWVRRRSGTKSILKSFLKQIKSMVNDLRPDVEASQSEWNATIADARKLPEPDGSCTAIITSPPYPNRHDYTRVFGVELMFDFLDWEETRELRYQSFHSHPEARPNRPTANGYSAPKRLTLAIKRLKKEGENPKVISLLEGYFLDSFHVLREAKRVCKPGGHIALVVGNAQYKGVPILVDEFIAEIGDSIGLTDCSLLAVRYRGNSAQQMKKHGRRPSRESIVVFRRRAGRV